MVRLGELSLSEPFGPKKPIEARDFSSKKKRPMQRGKEKIFSSAVFFRPVYARLFNRTVF